MDTRLIHDEAWEAATAIMGAFEPVFLPAEARDAHALVYDRCKAAIEMYLIRKAREERRLSRN